MASKFDLQTRRTGCAFLLLQMQGNVKIRRLKWDNIVIDMTTSYTNAWSLFKKAIKLQEQHTEMMSQIAFGVLSAATVGATGALSTYTQRKWQIGRASEVLVNGFEDAIQVGIDKAVTSLASVSHRTADIPLPTNYKGKLEILLNDTETEMIKAVNARITMVKDAPLEHFEDYDEKSLQEDIRAYWTNLDTKFKPKAINPTTLERKLEIGLWAYWVSRRMRVRGRNWFMKGVSGDYRDVGSPITDRLKHLGLISGKEKMFIDVDMLRPSGIVVLKKLERWGVGYHPYAPKPKP